MNWRPDSEAKYKQEREIGMLVGEVNEAPRMVGRGLAVGQYAANRWLQSGARGGCRD